MLQARGPLEARGPMLKHSKHRCWSCSGFDDNVSAALFMNFLSRPAFRSSPVCVSHAFFVTLLTVAVCFSGTSVYLSV